MFNLFKRKNKIKELETRIVALESEVIYLNKRNEIIKDKLKKADITTANIDDLKVNKTDISHIERIKMGAINVEKNYIFSAQTSCEPCPEDKEVINCENSSCKADRITLRVSSSEGNETTVIINDDGIVCSCNKKDLIKATKINLDGITIKNGKVIIKENKEEEK